MTEFRAIVGASGGPGREGTVELKGDVAKDRAAVGEMLHELGRLFERGGADDALTPGAVGFTDDELKGTARD